SSEYPRAAPQNGSNTIFIPDFLIAFKSRISPSRFMYSGFGSALFTFSDRGLGPGAAALGSGSSAGTFASIFFVASGSAGAPSGVENLIPLYSGGLCEAVMLMAPSAFWRMTSQEMAGVGAASVMTSG